MARITISNLNPAGSELFTDHENYMAELSEGEVDDIKGGLTPIIIVTAAVTIAVTATKSC